MSLPRVLSPQKFYRYFVAQYELTFFSNSATFIDVVISLYVAIGIT